jgi:hypothetical protein
MSQEKTSVARSFQPAIDIKICGLVAVFVTNRRVCKVGILRKTPGGHPHQHKVHVKEKDSTGATVDTHQGNIGATHALTLNSPLGISLRKEGMSIDRSVRPPSTDPSHDSFEWAVSLEGPQFYNRPIGAKEDGFHPLLTFDSGELYTSKVSESMLQRLDPGDSDFHDFGFVAVEIGIFIPLSSRLQATFKNGFQHVFTSRLDRFYEITIDNGPVHKPSGTATDAETYYEDDAIGGRLDDDEKIHFQSHVDPHRAGPEAACFVSYLNRSNPD